MVIRGGLTNSKREKRSEKQGRKASVYPTKRRFPKNTRRDLKKAFLLDQFKEIEEHNRMGKTRNL